MKSTLASVVELAAVLADPDVRVFDVRHDLVDHSAGRQAYDRGHIPGAHFLNHETDLAALKTGRNGRHPLPEREILAALMTTHGVTRQTQVVAYDASGGIYAAHLWWMLRWMGHEKVAVLDGGWQAWLAGHYPVSTDLPSSVATPSSEPFGPALAEAVDAAAVLANITEPAFTVIDARAANRFRGEVEPMDRVAGHIPGALNRPNGGNLGADGHFKPASELRSEFDALLGGRAATSIVHQCGSGITASHNLLAMEVAGLHGSRLYPGSWSEWSSDPSRPVATGA
jgi:thiosulfate/3-mercaptopyruvate sulfurtransferase